MSNLYFEKGQKGIKFPVTNIEDLTGVASPDVGDAHNLPKPKFPGEDGFQEELQEVADVRLHVTQNRWPADFLARHAVREGYDPYKMPAPLTNEGLRTSNPKGCANVVHMDTPMAMPDAVMHWLNSQGAALRNPSSKGINFLDRVPRLQAKLAKANEGALTKAFQAKYYFGRPRPEEVFMQGRCPTSVYTHYPEGAPKHPSYPAGHGAAAGACLAVFEEHYILTEDQRNTIKDCCYMWAMFRTFAGVHYADDNLAGMRVAGFFDVTS